MVIIKGFDAVVGLIIGFECFGIFGKIAFSVIFIEPILEQQIVGHVFIAPANYIEIKVSVAIGIKKYRVGIGTKRVLLEIGLGFRYKFSLFGLNQHLPRLPLAPTQIQVVETVAVDIAFGHARPGVGVHLRE